jgi:hypothetical protein
VLEDEVDEYKYSYNDKEKRIRKYKSRRINLEGNTHAQEISVSKLAV